MRMNQQIALQTLEYLKRTTPKGPSDADRLLSLISFYQEMLKAKQK